MIRRLLDWLYKRQAKRFPDDAWAWYQTCKKISQACGEAIENEHIASTDIGVVLDKTDRMLFGLRDHAMAVRPSLRRHNPALARQFDQVTEKVYRLRNQTSRFLIRSQGPYPFAYPDPIDQETRQVYYYRALEEAGFEARRIKKEIDNELQAVWLEMRQLIIQFERQTAG